MFLLLPILRDPGAVDMSRCEDGDGALLIATAYRGANTACPCMYRRFRLGHRHVGECASPGGRAREWGEVVTFLATFMMRGSSPTTRPATELLPGPLISGMLI